MDALVLEGPAPDLRLFQLDFKSVLKSQCTNR